MPSAGQGFDRNSKTCMDDGRDGVDELKTKFLPVISGEGRTASVGVCSVHLPSKQLATQV